MSTAIVAINQRAEEWRPAFWPPFPYIFAMANAPASLTDLLTVLRAHQSELRTLGIEAVTVFGSAARGERDARSDVDLAIRPGAGFSRGGFDHFGRLEMLRGRLSAILGCEVDLVEEPIARPRLREVIEREGVRAF